MQNSFMRQNATWCDCRSQVQAILFRVFVSLFLMFHWAFCVYFLGLLLQPGCNASTEIGTLSVIITMTIWGCCPPQLEPSLWHYCSMWRSSIDMTLMWLASMNTSHNKPRCHAKYSRSRSIQPLRCRCRFHWHVVSFGPRAPLMFGVISPPLYLEILPFFSKTYTQSSDIDDRLTCIKNFCDCITVLS